MKMRQHSFGVVIPTFNRAGSVGEAIESVLAQVRPANEIIVVDDGSTDDTAAVLAQFGNKIQVLKQMNAGVSAARNNGIARLTSEWITFLDSDDVWTENHLSLLDRDLSLFPSIEHVVAHIGDLEYVGANYKESLFSIKNLEFPRNKAELVKDALPLVISGMSCQSAAVRKSAFQSVGGFNEEYNMFEDTALFCNLAMTGSFLVTGDTIAIVRRLDDDSSALTNQHMQSPLEGTETHVEYIEDLLKLGPSPAQERLARQKLSGALFYLAELKKPTSVKTAIATLIKAARMNPSAPKGWMKSAISLLLWRSGFDLVTSKSRSFDRS